MRRETGDGKRETADVKRETGNYYPKKIKNIFPSLRESLSRCSERQG